MLYNSRRTSHSGTEYSSAALDSPGDNPRDVREPAVDMELDRTLYHPWFRGVVSGVLAAAIVSTILWGNGIALSPLPEWAMFGVLMMFGLRSFK